MLSQDQKKLIIEILLKENRRFFSKYKKNDLLGRTIADLSQSMRNESVNSKNKNQSYDKLLDLDNRSIKTENIYKQRLKEQGYESQINKENRAEKNTSIINKSLNKTKKDNSYGCSYCKKYKPPFTNYIGKDNIVISVCNNCRMQAERQALMKI